MNKSGPRKTVLAVRFAPVSCSGQEGREMLPVLLAMQGPPPPEDRGLKRLGTAAFEGRQIQNLFSNPGTATAEGVRIDRQTNNSQNSGTTFNANGFIGATEKQFKTGEVRDLRGIKLELPQNGTATTLVGAHDIALERHTQFVLLFPPRPSASHAVVLGVPPPAAGPASRNRIDEAVKAHAAEPEETEVCAASGCTQLARQQGQTSGAAAWALPLAGLGFTPRLNNPLYALDEDTSVHFLGEDELLFTFNLHTLVRRSAEQAGQGWRPRHIRAVVLSRMDGRVLRVQDWTVSAVGPCVWSLGGGRVLAQVGAELVTYGAGLVAQQRYTLHGPLLFASASPGAELVLVATLHEKHTKEEHAKLAAFPGPGRLVDEDYDLTGLDGTMQHIGERRMSTEPLQPALLQSSMVRAKPGRGDRWEIQQDSWSGQRKVLGRLSSGCEMEVKSLPGDLLFARGCVPSHSETAWCRVLDLKGATVLKGNQKPFELLQQAETNEDGRLFAIASTQFDRRIALDGSAHAADFPNVSVTVYATATGKQVFAAHPAAGSDLRNMFALSPSGATLAVLTHDALRIYNIVPELATK